MNRAHFVVPPCNNMCRKDYDPPQLAEYYALYDSAREGGRPTAEHVIPFIQKRRGWKNSITILFSEA